MWLEPSNATTSDILAGGPGAQGGWIGGWGYVRDLRILVMPAQGYLWVGRAGQPGRVSVHHGGTMLRVWQMGNPPILSLPAQSTQPLRRRGAASLGGHWRRWRMVPKHRCGHCAQASGCWRWMGQAGPLTATS